MLGQVFKATTLECNAGLGTLCQKGSCDMNTTGKWGENVMAIHALSASSFILAGQTHQSMPIPGFIPLRFSPTAQEQLPWIADNLNVKTGISNL